MQGEEKRGKSKLLTPCKNSLHWNDWRWFLNRLEPCELRRVTIRSPAVGFIIILPSHCLFSSFHRYSLALLQHSHASAFLRTSLTRTRVLVVGCSESVQYSRTCLHCTGASRGLSQRGSAPLQVTECFWCMQHPALTVGPWSRDPWLSRIVSLFPLFSR